MPLAANSESDSRSRTSARIATRTASDFVQPLRAAPGARELVFAGQPGNNAAHRGGRGRQPIHQLLHAGVLALLQQFEQTLVALVIDHYDPLSGAP